MQNTSTRSYVAMVKGKSVTFRHLGNVDLPLFRQVTSVAVIPFTKNGDIVAVQLRHRGLDIPGGHVEPGEKTPLETLEREAMEEACMTIIDPILVEVIESDFFEWPSYMLIYAAFVDKLLPFQTPEAEMSDERVIVTPKEFIKRYKAGDKRLMATAIKTAWHDLPKYS